MRESHQYLRNPKAGEEWAVISYKAGVKWTADVYGEDRLPEALGEVGPSVSKPLISREDS